MHIMIDLETMGLGPTAAIVQVGGVVFDPDNTYVGDTFTANVSLQSSMLAGMTTDESTISWWKQQSEDAKASISTNAEPLSDVLVALRDWISDQGDIDGVWSHGSCFDVPILEFAYRSFGAKPPWKYTRVRDTRTVFWLASKHGWTMPEHVTEHTALADAIWQAKCVQEALRVCS